MMLPDYFEFSLPTKVIYGAGILANLPEALKPMGKRRALLVTDSVLVSAGPVDKLNDSLSQSDITIAQVYDRVPPNSTIAAVEECAAQGKKAKCDLVRFSVNSITGGLDAQGEVTVRLQEDGMLALGKGTDPDIITAAAKAYVNGLNRLKYLKRNPSINAQERSL